MNVAVLFLRYNPEASARVRAKLGEIAERCSQTRFTIVGIDNANEAQTWQTVGHFANGVEYLVGGDNSSHEFSGWDRGWRELKANVAEAPDVVIMVNDALLNSKPVDQLKFVTDSILRGVANGRTVIGWVDTFARVSPDPIDTVARPMRIFGHSSRSHVCTTFIVFPRAMFEAVVPLARPFDMTRVYFDEFDPRIFKPDCGLSENYQRFLITHQQRVWYRRYEITRETYPTFRLKTRACIMEHLLGCRLREAGAQVVNLYAIHSARFPLPYLRRLPRLIGRGYMASYVLASRIYTGREILRASWRSYALKARPGKLPGSTPGAAGSRG